MKIDLKFEGDEAAMKLRNGGQPAEIEWPVFKGFKDLDKIYVNGEQFIFRRRSDEPATLEPILWPSLKSSE